MDVMILKLSEWLFELTLKPVKSFATTLGPAVRITNNPLQLFPLFFVNDRPQYRGDESRQIAIFSASIGARQKQPS